MMSDELLDSLKLFFIVMCISISLFCGGGFIMYVFNKYHETEIESYHQTLGEINDKLFCDNYPCGCYC